MKRLKISDEIQEIIRHLPPDLKKKVRLALDEIAKEPSLGKLLEDNLEGYQAYKIGRFRIIYQVHGSLIELLAAGPRKVIYQKVVLEMKHRL